MKIETCHVVAVDDLNTSTGIRTTTLSHCAMGFDELTAMEF